MRAVILGISIAMAATGAMAQYGSRQPTTTTTYDWRNNRSYTTTTNPNGGATVRGTNYQNGSQWRTTIDPNGQQRGTDASGNTWQYNPQTKTYLNHGTGQVCTGSGYARTCN